MEPLFGYLKLAEKLYFDKNKKFTGSWNFAPSKKNNLKVKNVVILGKKILQSKSPIYTTKQIYYESEHLSLDSTKSLKFLNWKTLLTAKKALELTFQWYKIYYNKHLKDKIVKFTLKQIEDYKKRLNFNS